MEYPKEIYVKDYFEIHNYYSNIYGKGRTIILMQVGSFHECYCTDDDGLNLVNLSQELDIVCTKKNGSKPISKSNPRMLGFPIYVTHSYVDKLVDMNYTVVLIDQVTEPPEPKRKVTGIYSPATHIDKKNNKTYYLVSLVLDKTKNKSNNYHLCLGMSAYDLSTGEGFTYETYSTDNDILIGLDDALRFFENYPPREVVLENNLSDDDKFADMTTDEILSYLNIVKENCYTIKVTQHKKIAYQKKIFESIYKIKSNVDVFEELGLQFFNWARYSLVLILDYVNSHQPRLLEKLRIPKLFSSNKYLYLGNRALEQLDMNTKNQETNMINIINFTKTAVGRRYLNCQITMPIINTLELNKRYDAIHKIMDNKHYEKIINFLEDIYDIDKLVRRLEINIINPFELYQLYISSHQIIKLSEYLDDNGLLSIFDISKDTINIIKSFYNKINETFDVNVINGLNFNNFFETDKSFYQKDIHNELDSLQTDIDSAQNFMDYLVKALEKHVDDKVFFKKNANKDDDAKTLINLKYNDRDGHYLLMTTRRCDIMKKSLEKVKIIKVGSIDLKVSDLVFESLPKSSNTKINCDKIKEISNNLVVLKTTMAKKLKEYFKNDMLNILNEYGEIIHSWSKKIGYIDFINSGAICAIKNHYCKPIIDEKNKSYFIAKELRHPIIEKINTDTTYVPHSISLGCEDQDGILLYGINSSGKSTLMKSIGINIILAQIGYYVSATEFTYSPYTSLFTRISGNDNMFRGLSSFMVEMFELIAILKRNTNNTLVISDELCKGSEEKSANIIICYMLETLINSNTSFITATHLHKLAQMKTVKNLKNLKIKHIKLTYDPINDTIVYDRELSDGQGETFYGLQIARYLMKDKKFNERTEEILREYENAFVKQSKYNSNVFMTCCEICKGRDNLETHHIVWQKDFDDDNINEKKFHLQKNDSSNLVNLCMECHDKVDRDEIIINGWKSTSSGRVFDYVYNDNISKKSKYTEELIEFIKNQKNITDEKMTRIKIKEKFNKKVSTKSIISIWT